MPNASQTYSSLKELKSPQKQKNTTDFSMPNASQT